MLMVFNVILNVCKKRLGETTVSRIAKIVLLRLGLNEFYCYVDFFWHADAHYASHYAFFRVNVY
jgi:hypothetical protein